MFSLEGRRALVTGGTQGVGRGIALALAGAGADIVLHGLVDDEHAQQTVADCRKLGVDCTLITGNLIEPDVETGVNSIVQSAIESHSDISLLASNAGTYIDKPFPEMDFETFDRTMKLNVYSHFFLVQAFARRWLADSIDGRVVLTGSINGRLAEQTHSGYDTSKGAVDAMVRTLAVELAPHNIRVNGMAPGLFRSPLTAPAIDQPAFRKWMELHTPNRTVPEADQCGGAVAFLMSDEAWHIHGQMLLVDGGMSVWQQPDLPETD